MLSSLKENKKIAAATHNIYACRILKDEHGGHPTFYQMCEDDGETHAGSRLLHLLQVLYTIIIFLISIIHVIWR